MGEEERGVNMMKGKDNTIAFGHIGLNVSDIDISEAFYQEVLGLRVADEFLQVPFRHASMARDGKTVLTLWEHNGAELQAPRPGLRHLAFEADSIEEVNRTKGLLENLGARWSEGLSPHAEGSASIHFEDPDGVRIEVYSTDRAHRAMNDAACVCAATGIPDFPAPVGRLGG
jgi:lactoylglutathione lyase